MKTKQLSRSISVLCLLYMILLLAGCGAKSPSVSYYSLNSIKPESLSAESSKKMDIALGIGPVSVPAYLKKSQITTRVAGTSQYQFDEFHRWAGIIEDDIASAIGNNLGVLLGSHQIAYFPWLHYFKPDYRVAIQIIQFDSDLNDDAALKARWVISDGPGKNVLASDQYLGRQPLANPSYDALVAAENLLLEKLSRQIAEELRVLVAQN